MRVCAACVLGVCATVCVHVCVRTPAASSLVGRVNPILLFVAPPTSLLLLPAPQLPVLKMLLRKTESNQYCGNEPLTNATAPAQTAPGGWFRVSVPMSAFACADAGLPLAQVDQFDLQNQVCLTKLQTLLICSCAVVW